MPSPVLEQEGFELTVDTIADHGSFGAHILPQGVGDTFPSQTFEQAGNVQAMQQEAIYSMPSEVFGQAGSGPSSDSASDAALRNLAAKEAAIFNGGVPLPDGEQERVNFLRKFNVLDSVGEESFDIITRLLADIFKVPIALVSLLDSNRQWFKSKVGSEVQETERELSFCAHLLDPLEPSILMVPDATKDKRFKDNPLVTGDPFIRFYCGAPIILEGYRLGSLCVIDRVPKTSVGQKDAMLLANFANIVAGLINREQKQAKQYDMVENPSFLIDVNEPKWPILYMNDPARSSVGSASADTPCFLDLFSFDNSEGISEQLEARAVYGTFLDSKACVCIFHPASQCGFGGGFEDVLFPYKQVGVPDNASIDAGRSKEYNFVIIKWNKDQPAPPPKFNSLGSSKVIMVQSQDELNVALKQDLCAVLFTSRHCAACVHFQEFYAMSCNFMKGVQFCMVSVDACPAMKEFRSRAIFLPSVDFYKQGVLIDQLSGGHCALFRQKLQALLKTSECSLRRKQEPLAPVENKSSGRDEWKSPEVKRNSKISGMQARFNMEREYNKSLEVLLSSSVANELRELRDTRDATLARIPLLQQELMRRRRTLAAAFSTAGCPLMSKPILEADDDNDEDEEGRFPRELPCYQFNGTVANFLCVPLMKCRVLIYGGQRADLLEAGMTQMGIDAHRQPRTARSSHIIPTEKRYGRPLAIVDVCDSMTPKRTWEWFDRVSDALTPGGAFATISVDFNLLELLAMFGEQFGWNINCREGAKKDYGIVLMEKQESCDELLRSGNVAELFASIP